MLEGPMTQSEFVQVMDKIVDEKQQAFLERYRRSTFLYRDQTPRGEWINVYRDDQGCTWEDKSNFVSSMK